MFKICLLFFKAWIPDHISTIHCLRAEHREAELLCPSPTLCRLGISFTDEMGAPALSGWNSLRSLNQVPLPCLLNQEKTQKPGNLTGISELSLILGNRIMAHVTSPKHYVYLNTCKTPMGGEMITLFILQRMNQGTGMLSHLDQVIK